MFTLVIGGAASGKSAFAEDLMRRTKCAHKIYIATMEPFDDECQARIHKHRRQRAKQKFETVECYRNLAAVCVPEGSAVLLECMSNLCANERYSPKGSGEKALAAILVGVEGLLAQCGELVVVSNEVFSGGSRYEGDTLGYLRLLADVNRALAARADRVYEIVCGLPVEHKGGNGKHGIS